MTDKQASTFTFFAKFGDACACLSEEQRKEVFYAICMYGLYGEEPEMAEPLAHAFLVMAEDDLDNSKRMREVGKMGGRPKKQQDKEVFETEKPEVSETEKPEVMQGNPKTENPYQSIPSQTIPSQTKGEAKRTRFVPPTPREVEGYARSKGASIDAQRFCDFYASKGWMVGKSKMRDWHAAARNWWARDGGAPAKAGEFAAYGAGATEWKALG